MENIAQFHWNDHFSKRIHTLLSLKGMFIYIQCRIGGISRPALSSILNSLTLSWHSIKELAAATKKPVSRRASLNLHVKSSGNSTLVPGHRRVRHVSRGRTMVGMTRKFQNLNIPATSAGEGRGRREGGGRRESENEEKFYPSDSPQRRVRWMDPRTERK